MDQRIIDRLEENLEDLNTAMLEEFRRDTPFYREMTEEIERDVKKQIYRITSSFIRYLHYGGRVPKDFLQALGRIAMARELQGFELKDFIDGVYAGKLFAWNFIRENLAGEISENDLLEMAEAIDRFYQEIISPLAGTYLNHQKESIAEFNRALNTFRAILDRGELQERITSTACRSMGFERAVFFVYEREALLPVSAVSLRDKVWAGAYLEQAHYYPVSPFGQTLESKAFYRPAIITADLGEFGAGDFSLIKPMPDAPFVLVPINPSGSPKGLLYLETRHDHLRVTNWELELLQIYADTVGLALENSRLYREVVMRGRALDHLMSRVNTAHEEERARIARELHDSVAQSMLKIIYSAGFALDFIKEEPHLAGEEMEEVQDQAKECLRELRAIIGNLRPSSLEILGLHETIRRYAEDFEEEYAISTNVELAGLDNLTKAAELAIFRVLQEALTNVRKHAQADAVHISTLEQEGQLALTIEDNGRGFDLESVEAEQERGRHLGLLAMQERAELMGGDFSVQSSRGRGTIISIRLPLISKD